MKYLNRITITIIIVFVSFSSLIAQEKWDYANSTPYETVKSHFYFLDKDSYNPKVAVYTLGEIDLSSKAKKSYVIKLKDIINALDLDIENVLDRKKGIVYKDKYQLFSKEPKIYLNRVNRKWVYSPETVEAIPILYRKYVLREQESTEKKTSSEAVINKLIINDSSGVIFSMGTPRSTVISHLIFLSDTLYDPQLASKTINFSPQDTANAIDLGIKLKQIFQGSKKQLFDFSTLSNDSNYIDTANGEAIYHPNEDFPELYLEKIDGKWLYSRATSKLIQSVHEEMYEGDAEDVFLFSDKFKRWAGVKNSIPIGNFLYWQIYMLLYFIGIYLLLILTNKLAVKWIFDKILKNSAYKKTVFQIFSVITFIILFEVIKYYAPAFEFSMDYNFILIKSIHLFIIFYCTLLAIYVVNLLKIFFTAGRTYDSQFGIVIFASLIIKTIIFIVSFLFVIDALDFNLVNFLAGLSIGGFALALGAQDTIKNFLGSLMIFADKSFRVGDWISNGKVSGTVEEIGLRSTKIRTFHNSLVTVPNSMLSDNNIDNLGRRIYRRYKTKIIVKYETPIETVEAFTDRISKLIEKHPQTRKDFYMVYINDFSSYGIEILIYTFFEVSDWNQEMKAKHDLIKSILELKDEVGIKFSIPLMAKTD